MSMTTGDDLGNSDVFVKLAVMLFPLAEEAVRQGMTMKKFERGLFGGLLCTGNRRDRLSAVGIYENGRDKNETNDNQRTSVHDRQRTASETRPTTWRWSRPAQVQGMMIFRPG